MLFQPNDQEVQRAVHNLVEALSTIRAERTRTKAAVALQTIAASLEATPESLAADLTAAGTAILRVTFPERVARPKKDAPES